MPVPCAPEVTVTHATSLVADHAHAAAAVTVTVAVAASFVNDVRSGDTTYSHGADTASWLTDTGRPATVSVPERPALAVFGAALKVTAPAPEPLAPLTIESQLDGELAVHEHALWVVTVTEPDPPDAWKETEDVERL